MIILIVLDLTERGMRSVFGLNYKDLVFYECILIIDYLNRNRNQAIREVGDFLSSLRGYLRHSLYDLRGKMYSTEFNDLQKGKKSLQRMLLFSSQDIASLFEHFGLAFIHNQDSTAFFAIKDIINEAELYGKMQAFRKESWKR
jgi:hypothetical protein